MGSRMANNLIKAGYRVAVHDMYCIYIFFLQTIWISVNYTYLLVMSNQKYQISKAMLIPVLFM